MQSIDVFNNSETVQKNILKPYRKIRSDARKRRRYDNENIFTFDIESTSYEDDHGHKWAWMYLFTVCINGYTFYGRTWDQFTTFVRIINVDDVPCRVIWVHNLSFEFQFMRDLLPFDFVYARTPRKPMFARVGNMEFRCTYFLTHLSLQNVAKQFHTEHKKLVGDLDYSLIRHEKTPITPQEMKYAENDVIILYEFIRSEIKRRGSIANIPHTQTGYIRSEFLEHLKHAEDPYCMRKIVKQIAPIDLKLFQKLERSFWGGITHANYKAVLQGDLLNVDSYDKTSSYPGAMVSCKYPMTNFIRINTNYEKYLRDPEYACIVDIVFYDLKAKTANGIISKSKCTKIVGGVDSNGRMIAAKEMHITCTDVDFDNIERMYTYTRIEISEIYVSHYGYLPKEYILFILQLYEKKTSLKGITDREDEYMYNKQLINAGYGNMVMNPYTDTVDYIGGEWSTTPPVPADLYEYYYKQHKTVLVYQWGVWVTAHARADLVKAMELLGDNCAYTDTDSVKDTSQNRKIIDVLNRDIHTRNKAASETLGIPWELFAPADIKGRTHEIGLWEYEYTAVRFKTLGCKRYVCKIAPKKPVHGKYRTGNLLPYSRRATCYESHVTVAGVPKSTIEKYVHDHGFDSFRHNFILHEDESNKNTLTYIDSKPVELTVTDYTGITHTFIAGNGVHVAPTTYLMGLPAPYARFLQGHAVSELKIVKRRKDYV